MSDAEFFRGYGAGATEGMMNRFRFSIAGLVALVGTAAIGFAATHVASPGWAGGLLSLTLLIMLMSIMLIVVRRGPRRDAWIWFAVFGWTHLFLVFAPWFDTSIGRRLLGSMLFRELYPVLHAASANAGMGGFGGMGGMGMGGGVAPAPAPAGFVDSRDFIQIGQSLETLLWAFLGGWAASSLSSGREGEVPGPRQSSAPGANREPQPTE